MFPFPSVPNILPLLHMIAMFLRHRKRIKQRQQFQMLTDLINFINMFMNLELNWLNLMILIHKYLQRRHKKRWLYKPHLLLHHLLGYRFENLNGIPHWNTCIVKLKNPILLKIHIFQSSSFSKRCLGNGTY